MWFVVQPISIAPIIFKSFFHGCGHSFNKVFSRYAVGSISYERCTNGERERFGGISETVIFFLQTLLYIL